MSKSRSNSFAQDNIEYSGEGSDENTAQKMKFSIKDFFNKCDQVYCGFGYIYWKNP